MNYIKLILMHERVNLLTEIFAITDICYIQTTGMPYFNFRNYAR